MNTLSLDEMLDQCSNVGPDGHRTDDLAPERPLPAVVDGADFLTQKLRRPPELVHGLIHQGSKTILAGGSKTFKTWNLTDLGLAVATGEPWLSFKTTKGRVLFVNFEIPEIFFQDRVAAVTKEKGIILAPGQFELWNLRGFSASYHVLIPKIIERAKDSGYVLIILDPIYKLYGNTDENSAGGVALLMNSLESLTVETGATVAFGAHYAKGNAANKETIDRVSGSGVFARDPDSLINFTRHEKEDAFTVEAALRNFKPVEPFVVRWQYPLMRRADELDPAKLKTPKGRPTKHTAATMVLALKEQKRRLTTPEWRDLCDSEKGIPKSTFYELKDEAAALPEVAQTKAGLWFYKAPKK